MTLGNFLMLQNFHVTTEECLKFWCQYFFKFLKYFFFLIYNTKNSSNSDTIYFRNYLIELKIIILRSRFCLHGREANIKKYFLISFQRYILVISIFNKSESETDRF